MHAWVPSSMGCVPLYQCERDGRDCSSHKTLYVHACSMHAGTNNVLTAVHPTMFQHPMACVLPPCLPQVMDYVTSTEGRKILVHCHAGLGRTGLAIACYFLYTQQYTARRAVEAVRRDRPGALQTRQQELFTFIFEQYLAHLRYVQPCVSSGSTIVCSGGSTHVHGGQTCMRRCWVCRRMCLR